MINLSVTHMQICNDISSFLNVVLLLWLIPRPPSLSSHNSTSPFQFATQVQNRNPCSLNQRPGRYRLSQEIHSGQFKESLSVHGLWSQLFYCSSMTFADYILGVGPTFLLVS